MRAVSFDFIWGLMEDYSPGDSLSHSSEELLQRGGEEASDFGKGVGFKINTQKSLIVQYTNNERS